MAVALALAAAGLNGSADFFGGLASRRTQMAVVAVVVWSQAIGLVSALGIASVDGSGPSGEDCLWGALAGIALAGALLALYRGFQVGRVGLVSPVAAVGSATLPVAWGLIGGERPSAIACAGIALGLAAIGLIARSHARGPDSQRGAAAGLPQGLLAGVCFGLCFTLLSLIDGDASIWPIAAARASAVAAMIVVVAATGVGARPARAAYGSLAACGVLSVLGQGAFVAANQHGLLSLVVVLASLYPAATVSLARVVERESLTRTQLAGMGLALVSVGLMVSG